MLFTKKVLMNITTVTAMATSETATPMILIVDQDGEVCEVVAVTDSPGDGGETSVLDTSSL